MAQTVPHPTCPSVSDFKSHEHSDDEWEYEYDDNETEDYYITTDFSGIKIPGFFTKAFPKRPDVGNANINDGNNAATPGDGEDEQGDLAHDNNEGDEDDEDDDTVPNTTTSQTHDDENEDDEEGDDDDALSIGSVELPPGLVGTKADDEDDAGVEEEEEEEVDESKPIQIVGLETENPVISFGGSVFSCEWASTIGSDMLFMSATDVGFPDTRAGTPASIRGSSRVRDIRSGGGTGPIEHDEEDGGEEDEDVDMDDELETSTSSRIHGGAHLPLPPPPIVPLRSFAHHDLISVSAARLIARPAKLKARQHLPSAMNVTSSAMAAEHRTSHIQNQGRAPNVTAAVAASARSNAQLDFLNKLREIMVGNGETGLVRYGGPIGMSSRPVIAAVPDPTPSTISTPTATLSRLTTRKQPDPSR